MSYDISPKPNVNLNILVVDDEADVRETLVSFLEEMECFNMIIEAADGSEAFRKFQMQSFDIVITDLTMPKLRGLELIRSIQEVQIREKKKVNSDCSICVLSGNLTDIEVKKAIGYGVKHVLAKPCSYEDFVEKVQRILIKEHRSKIKVAKRE